MKSTDNITDITTILPPIDYTTDLIEDLTTTSVPDILLDNLTSIQDNLTKLESDSFMLESLSQIITNDTNNSTILKVTDGSETNINIGYSESTYIYVYTALIVAAILLTTFRSFIFFKICMNASRGLHNTMFNNVLKATMRFFDTNPSGKYIRSRDSPKKFNI